MRKISESIDDELVIRAGGEFLIEKRANSGPRTLSCSELQKSHFGSMPFVDFPFETEAEVGVSSGVVPVVGDLTLVDSLPFSPQKLGILTSSCFRVTLVLARICWANCAAAACALALMTTFCCVFVTVRPAPEPPG